MKIYKVQAPSGKMTSKTYNRGMAFKVRNALNGYFKTDKFKVVVYGEARVHDHESLMYDPKKYVITHFEMS